ncbi:MAG: M16 family metallopeptidase [Bacteroidota bacterium]
MINYQRFFLTNGLTVIHHHDPNTKLCVLNILYKVGSKNELPNKTGFAHLFEHLMFGGSVNISDYDDELQKAGGENNAFTSNDITNYYLTLPQKNIETGFWLESDRMLSLDFSEQSLDVQRNVVIEEFKERYLNQPYGDIWLKLLPLAYKIHPYNWPTIGKEISHIESASLDDVKNFFFSFYAPNNAILVVAGNIDLEQTKALCQKWFAEIPSREVRKPDYEQEPKQTEARFLSIEADVPLHAIVKAYHMPARMENGYYESDLLSDMLGSGRSAILYQELVKNQRLFSELDCYITGDIDRGLFVIEGKLMKNITHEKANEEIEKTLRLALESIEEKDLQKVKNKTETTIRFNEVNVLNRAMKLAYCEMLGDIDLANSEADQYLKVNLQTLKAMGKDMLRAENCSTLFYISKNAK